MSDQIPQQNQQQNIAPTQQFMQMPPVQQVLFNNIKVQMGQPPQQQQQYFQYAQYQQPIQVPQVSFQPMQQPFMQQQMPIIVRDENLPFQANDAPFPIKITCPVCKKDGLTRITEEIGAGTYLVSYLLFLCTGCCCCWIPCCLRDCKDKIHHCEFCQAEVGIMPYNLC